MTTLKKGSQGNEVKILQSKLNQYGRYGLIVDGVFGAKTQEAVKDYQKKHNLSVDGIVGPKTWEALGVTNPRYITKIIVHCSATPEGKDYTTEDIRKWHIARGFSDIGYHYVIYRDGSIHKGRDEKITGAHCTGQNTCSIGVCYIGGVADDGKNTPKDTRTLQQKNSLVALLKDLRHKYPQAKIYSHRDFAAKACPSFDATKEYANL